MQNEVRSVELTEEERVLMNLEAQDIDALRILGSIPVGTDLYRHMMEQYKELSSNRKEISQVV